MSRNSSIYIYIICTLFSLFTGSSGITNGEEDGDNHPYVGLFMAHTSDKVPLWMCSCTLLSENIILTAGHCTASPAAFATIWFDADVESGYPSNGYPYYAEGDVWGEVQTHPQYDINAFYSHDLGVVVIQGQSDDFSMPTQFGQLPDYDEFDDLKVGAHTIFDSVGYGLQQINPVHVEAIKIRMISHPHLIQKKSGLVGKNGQIWLLSNNHATGGSCFGDSGGPNFIADSNVIGGVTSFGLNGNCAGTGGVYRVDQADDLDWLYGEFYAEITGESKQDKDKPNDKGGKAAALSNDEIQSENSHSVNSDDKFDTDIYTVMIICLFIVLVICISVVVFVIRKQMGEKTADDLDIDIEVSQVSEESNENETKDVEVR